MIEKNANGLADQRYIAGTVVIALRQFAHGDLPTLLSFLRR